jgi:hypothetical protein
MALPALRARLGLGFGRSYATGIAKVTRGGNGSVFAGPSGGNGGGFARTFTTAPTTTAAPVPPAMPCDSLHERFMSLRVSTVVGFVCAIVAVRYFVRMERKVDKLEKKIDKVEWNTGYIRKY